MRKLITFILLAAAFVGGYHLGRQPDSPDLFAWAQQAYQQASQAGRQILAMTHGEPNNLLQQTCPDKLKVDVDGKTYVLSADGGNQVAAAEAARP